MLARVERFMQDYYRAAQTIFRVSQIVGERLALSITASGAGMLGSLRETLRRETLSTHEADRRLSPARP